MISVGWSHAFSWGLFAAQYFQSTDVVLQDARNSFDAADSSGFNGYAINSEIYLTRDNAD